MTNFFTLKMWFSINPGSLMPVFHYALVVVVLLFLVATFAFKYKYNKQKKTLYNRIFSSLFNFSLTGTIIGAFVLFFTYERVPFLSARFWFIVWFLVHAVWGWFIYKKLKKIPEIKDQIKANKEYQKYIP